MTVNEKSTIVYTISPTDEDGNAITPKTGTYKVSDGVGNVVIAETNIVPLSETMTVVLTCDDLSISNNNKDRILTTSFTYDSASGTDLCANEEAGFQITDLTGIS